MIYYIFSDEPDPIPWKADIVRHYDFSQLEEFVTAFNLGMVREDIDCIILLEYTDPEEKEKIEELADRIDEDQPNITFYQRLDPQTIAKMVDDLVTENSRKRPAFS